MVAWARSGTPRQVGPPRARTLPRTWRGYRSRSAARCRGPCRWRVLDEAHAADVNDPEQDEGQDRCREGELDGGHAVRVPRERPPGTSRDGRSGQGRPPRGCPPSLPRGAAAAIFHDGQKEPRADVDAPPRQRVWARQRCTTSATKASPCDSLRQAWEKEALALRGCASGGSSASRTRIGTATAWPATIASASPSEGRKSSRP